jgi:peptide/nickel transport system ATP-binding protein
MTSGQSDAPVLDVRGLSVEYASENGTVHAVTDVSFALRRGEVLGLAGESGSGKSTLAYAAARLLPDSAAITAGEVLYYPGAQRPGAQRNQAGAPDKPMNLLNLSTEELRRLRWSDLAVVFQSAMNALNPVMTLGAQIDDVLLTQRPRMRGRARHMRARDLLRLVGISSDRIRSYPHELSGGMRQRAGIALALALSPQIIIMDEPTTALDVVVQREILSELLRLREQLEFAIIFITHDLSLLLELADRVAIMYAGRLVEQATQRDLYRTPRHPYSYGLINAFPRLRGPRRVAMGIPGSPPDLRTPPPGCAFHPRCPLAFDACQSTTPELRPAITGSEQLVACHLYDPAYRPTPPDTSEIAAGYDARVEGSRM